MGFHARARDRTGDLDLNKQRTNRSVGNTTSAYLWKQINIMRFFPVKPNSNVSTAKHVTRLLP
ncbi:hypothetical protein HanXRQr2_Chr14g0641631 [Helianthus annuus]|uniref:Uncharacterized protein n=1 Tax=Helianthus annuus TaxID=4232 RepID=A0A251SGZ6_HELAN|nr:hypothetical protein HanXRQr2_Chr14g0641631 [Helianthus annuus]